MDLCFTAQKNLLYGATMPNLWRVGLTLAAFFFCTQGMSFGHITPLIRGWNNPSCPLTSGHSFAGILTPFTTSRGPTCSFVYVWSPNMHTGTQNAGTHQKILKLLKSQLQHYLFFPDVFYQFSRWMGNLEPETYKNFRFFPWTGGFLETGQIAKPTGDPHRKAHGNPTWTPAEVPKVWSWFPPIIQVPYFERRYHGRAAPRSDVW